MTTPDPDPTFYQRFYTAARNAGPPDVEKKAQASSKSVISLFVPPLPPSPARARERERRN
ncbi:hypothetical protein L873DRAFT_1801145 [Choiromyces venosus 120613-1]|uniref:Uncharacterized protein n=1 Tax=Choiromyces venosus 120613-1 TaxID=1336337 RepID=A0A3N4JXN5_9PEZI|nr:hypothetical protein L873DRAFT_1801145 [Choiromyces venosus 120613-1]